MSSAAENAEILIRMLTAPPEDGSPRAQRGAAERAQLLRTVERMRVDVPQHEHEGLLRWVAHLQITRGLSPRTAVVYLAALSLFAAWLAEEGQSLGTATAALIERWQQHLFVDRRMRGRTRDLNLVAVRRFYAWREKDAGQPNPARGMQGPKREKKKPRKFSLAHLRRLFATLDQTTVLGRRDFALLLLVYATGARRMEVAEISIEQFEFDNSGGRVTFRGKGRKERVVPFDKPVREALLTWRADRDALDIIDHDAMFVGLAGPNKGRRLRKSGLSACILRAGEAAGLRMGNGEVGLHRLRCTFATDLYDLGFDIKTIAVLMGHDDITTTEQYIDISERQMAARMPGKRILEVTGGKTHERLPLWAQQKLSGLGREDEPAGEF